MVGTLLLYHPVMSPLRYNGADRMFRQACCGISDGLCEEYIQRRPINNCSEYKPPALCELCSLLWIKMSEILI